LKGAGGGGRKKRRREEEQPRYWIHIYRESNIYCRILHAGKEQPDLPHPCPEISGECKERIESEASAPRGPGCAEAATGVEAGADRSPARTREGFGFFKDGEPWSNVRMECFVACSGQAGISFVDADVGVTDMEVGEVVISWQPGGHGVGDLVGLRREALSLYESTEGLGISEVLLHRRRGSYTGA